MTDRVKTFPCSQCGEPMPFDFQVARRHVNEKHPIFANSLMSASRLTHFGVGSTRIQEARNCHWNDSADLPDHDMALMNERNGCDACILLAALDARDG